MLHRPPKRFAKAVSSTDLCAIGDLQGIRFTTRTTHATRSFRHRMKKFRLSELLNKTIKGAMGLSCKSDTIISDQSVCVSVFTFPATSSSHSSGLLV